MFMVAGYTYHSGKEVILRFSKVCSMHNASSFHVTVSLLLSSAGADLINYNHTSVYVCVSMCLLASNLLDRCVTVLDSDS